MSTSSAPGITRLRYRGRSYEVVRGENGVVQVLLCSRSGKVEIKGPVAFAVAMRAGRGRARHPSNRSRTLRGVARKAAARKRR
jgi:hypothetical protein